MREQIQALVKLSAIDEKAAKVEQELRDIPQDLEEMKQSLKQLERLVAGRQEEVSGAEHLLSLQEKDVTDRENMLSLAKAKTAKAKSPREADAADRELEGIRKMIKDGEAERDRLKALIAASKEKLAEPLKMLEETATEIASTEESLKAKLDALIAERDSIVSGRNEWTRLISKNHLSLYERLRGKLHPPVTEAINGICQGCKMALPPQKYIEVQKGTSIYQCMSCNRICYHKDAIVD